MGVWSYADHVETLGTTHSTLAEALRPFSSIRHVLEWMQEAGLPLGSLDMVTQDEFSHDALIPLPSGEWLSFGMT
jgi:hypothetical protein